MPYEMTEFLPPIFILFILFRRTKKPRRVRPGYLWVAPVIMAVLGALFVGGAIYRDAPKLTTFEVLIVVGAAIVGGALGAFRAHGLHLTRHAETGIIEATLSVWGLVVILIWMVGRNILNHSELHTALTPFGVFNAAMLALALASVIARAIVLSKRCAALGLKTATAQVIERAQN